MSLRISPAGSPASLRPPVPWRPWSVDRGNISVRLPPRVHGSRNFAMASKGHNSSVVVDPNDFAAKSCESGIEHNAFLVATADPDVVSIICQAPPIDYADRDGVVFTTTFDFLITLRDGTRQAVMVKKADKVRRAELEILAARIASQLPEGFADCVCLVTDEDLPAWLVSNARLIHAVRLDRACELDEEVAARAEAIFEPVSIAELCSPWAPRGPRSVARLIFAGRIRQLHRGLIEPATMVVATGNMPA